MILAYLYPTHGNVSHDFIESRDKVLEEFACPRVSARSGPSGVAMNRNMIARWFLDESDEDYILWVDSDMVFGPEAVYELKATQEPLVAAHAVRVSDSAQTRPAAVQRAKDGSFEPLELNGQKLQSTAGVGMAFTLIHREVYSATGVRTGHPHIQRMIGDYIVGEDVGMCQYAIEAGFVPKLAVNVHVGHIKPQTFWP